MMNFDHDYQLAQKDLSEFAAGGHWLTEDRVNRISRTLSFYKEELRQNDADLKASQALASEMQQAREAAQAEKLSLEEQIDLLKNELTVARDQMEALRSQNEDQFARYVDLVDELAEIQQPKEYVDLLRKPEEQIDLLKNELTVARDQMEALRSRNDDLFAQYVDLVDETADQLRPEPVPAVHNSHSVTRIETMELEQEISSNADRNAATAELDGYLNSGWEVLNITKMFAGSAPVADLIDYTTWRYITLKRVVQVAESQPAPVMAEERLTVVEPDEEQDGETVIEFEAIASAEAVLTADEVRYHKPKSLRDAVQAIRDVLDANPVARSIRDNGLEGHNRIVMQQAQEAFVRGAEESAKRMDAGRTRPLFEIEEKAS